MRKVDERGDVALIKAAFCRDDCDFLLLWKKIELDRHEALLGGWFQRLEDILVAGIVGNHEHEFRSEEHTSELQSLMRISYAVFCLKKKNEQKTYEDYKT